MIEYKPPTPGKPQPHPLPEGIAGVEAMVSVARHPKQRALIGLCGYAGLRLGEALAVRTSWFDPSPVGKSIGTLRVRGKGDKERFVPVSQRCWDAISESFAEAMVGNGVLINYEDRGARKAVTSLGRRAHLSRPVASHDLRATFATHLMNMGVNMRVVQEILGHANITTTEVYTGVTRLAMIEAVDF